MNILKNIKTKNPLLISDNAFLYNTNRKIQIHRNHIMNPNDTFYIEGSAIYKLNDIKHRFNSKGNYEITFTENNFIITTENDIIIESNKLIDISDYNFIVLINNENYKVIYYNNDIDITLLELSQNIIYDCVIYNKPSDNFYSFLLELKNMNIINYNFLLIKSNVIDLKIDNYLVSNSDNKSYDLFEYNFIINQIRTYKNNSKYINILGGSLDLMDYIYFNEWLKIWLNEFIKPGGKFYNNFKEIKHQKLFLHNLKIYRIKKIYDRLDNNFLAIHNLTNLINDNS
jgi:hypothetical protein